jgi:hypothetical protein
MKKEYLYIGAAILALGVWYKWNKDKQPKTNTTPENNLSTQTIGDNNPNIVLSQTNGSYDGSGIAGARLKPEYKFMDNSPEKNAFMQASIDKYRIGGRPNAQDTITTSFGSYIFISQGTNPITNRPNGYWAKL